MAVRLLDPGVWNVVSSWLLAEAWPAFSCVAALSGHLVVSVLSPPARPALGRALFALYLLGSGLVAAPLIVQAETFRPGGLLRMGLIAVGLALGAVFVAGITSSSSRARGPFRPALAFLEVVLLIPVGAWALRGITPPSWYGAVLGAVGGSALAESLLGASSGRRSLSALASALVLVVGVGLYWLSGE